jgi:Uma2 family endonuclease
MSTTAKTTLDEYHRMMAEGAFDGPGTHRVELIRGEIVPVSPISPLHNDVVDRLNEWSICSLPRGAATVRIQGSIGLPALESEPEPDVVWLKRRKYAKRLPVSKDVLLLIEVADTSLVKDRELKGPAYAEAAIAEYWIVNLVDSSIEVYREPKASRYSNQRIYTLRQQVEPLAFPSLSLRIASLFE